MSRLSYRYGEGEILGFKSGCWMWMKRVMLERWRLKEFKKERLKQEQEVWFQCGVISSLQNPNK
uniref:Uncharacterized protein n=1 Tax=Brassica oleracea TaxID=3712 RepID=A0A3P6AF05_BRAOL|nr:unnamed protein product [Brassica oleracea]